MENIQLKAIERKKEEKLNYLRADKLVPGVVYGHKQEPIMIKIDNSDMLRAYRKAGENHIISLEVGKSKIDVLVHEVQRDPVKGSFLHIDFYAITKGEKVHTHIPLAFVGESKAVKEGAMLEELVKELEVKCLPKDLVDSFEVNIASLEKAGDSIKVSDIKIDTEKYHILNSEDETIASVHMPSAHKVEDEEETNAEESSEETKEEEK